MRDAKPCRGPYRIGKELGLLYSVIYKNESLVVLNTLLKQLENLI
jgi:hypothetical protein